ncbi:MAG: hypothetical protein H0T69_05335, partial [Thermoleophilaceae bacterium]|nr:hypothetical protein [Thermoleophilaceae bacterium]
MLGTQGAPARSRRRDRRTRELSEAAPEPLPSARATVVRAQPFASREEACAWLAGLGAEEEALDDELGSALAALNRALRLYRAATADPYLAELSAGRALV